MSDRLFVLLLGAAILCINLVWSFARGAQLRSKYSRAQLPASLPLAWGTTLIGAVALYVGAWLSPSGGSLLEPTWGVGLAPSGVAIFSLGWIALLVDSRSRLLPTAVTLVILGEVVSAWLIYGFYAGFTEASLLAPLIGAAIWFVPIFAGEATKNMGRGDLKLAPVLGFAVATSSLTLAIAGLVLAFVTAAIQSVLVLAQSRQSGQKIAMGPHLISGAWMAWAAGAVGPMLFT